MVRCRGRSKKIDSIHSSFIITLYGATSRVARSSSLFPSSQPFSHERLSFCRSSHECYHEITRNTWNYYSNPRSNETPRSFDQPLVFCEDQPPDLQYCIIIVHLQQHISAGQRLSCRIESAAEAAAETVRGLASLVLSCS